MNTPDPTGVVLTSSPHELVLGAQQVPTSPAAATRPPAASPGVGLSATSPPGAPALPFDPAQLGQALAQLAGEFFTPSAPVSAPAPITPGGSPSSPGTSSVPAPATPGNAADPVLGADLFAGLHDAARWPLVESAYSEGNVPYFIQSPTPPSAPTPNLDTSRLQALDAGSSEPLNTGSTGVFDPHAVRRQFPILEERPHGKRLVWLDNAATTQKPRTVIDRLSYFYEHENSNIHRAAHTLAARATDAYEAARESTRKFLNASSTDEILFVRGATEGINLVAQTFGRKHVGPGDEIVITWLEHHANIVPWQMLCSEKGAKLRVAPVDDRGQVILEEYERLLNDRTKLVALPQVSNALGTVTPAEEMVAIAHRYGARVLVDGAQSVSHRATDVQRLNADFFVFSGHKVFAPTGIGAVYAKRELLDEMPPWQGGGNMIADVTFTRTRYQPPPARFEAGTGSIADAAGLGAALDWLSRLGLPQVERYEHELLTYATACLSTISGLTIVGTAPEKAGVVSFVLDGLRTEDIGAALDREGIAVRSGHHCAQPILRRFGLESTVRASFAPYNLHDDVDALVGALERLKATST